MTKKSFLSVLIVLLLMANVVMVGSKEYKVSVSKGFEKTYIVTNAMNAKYFGRSIKKGDKIKIQVTDVEESEVSGDKYFIAIGDVFINDEKVAEDHNLVYPSAVFLIYPDIHWIDKYLKPAFDSLGASIKISDNGKYVRVECSFEVDVYTFNRVYVWKNGILEYLYASMEVGGEKISELEFGKKGTSLLVIIVPIIVIAAIMIFVVLRKIRAR